MAPRVHNSGHWTIEGAHTSQFEQHIRAVAGWPLGPTEAAARVEMLNLRLREMVSSGRYGDELFVSDVRMIDNASGDEAQWVSENLASILPAPAVETHGNAEQAGPCGTNSEKVGATERPVQNRTQRSQPFLYTPRTARVRSPGTIPPNP